MYCVGIDIAKRKHVAFTLDGEGEPVGKTLRIANDREGFDALLAHLSSLQTTVTVGLEATGHYWLALYSVLTEAGYEVIVLNPLQVQAYRKSGIRKRKNDRYDAFWIADFIRINHRLQSSPAVQPDLVASAASSASWTASSPSTKRVSPAFSSRRHASCWPKP